MRRTLEVRCGLLGLAAASLIAAGVTVGVVGAATGETVAQPTTAPEVLTTIEAPTTTSQSTTTEAPMTTTTTTLAATLTTFPVGSGTYCMGTDIVIRTAPISSARDSTATALTGEDSGTVRSM